MTPYPTVYPKGLWHIFRGTWKSRVKTMGKTSRPLFALRFKTTIAAWPMGQQGFQKWEIGLPLFRASNPTVFSSTSSGFRVISLL
ncbi:hypothetical protein TNCT_498821 [Trichonephila clavata]|uniref:Uncharacterized protein n=1 Tax=Trichonephila clavata TaxID=2740835 RepID=A0A8X6FWJ2_TRICU|nr:hypothetical protein TNCT_498821 [Trichonephila clavata]